MELTTMRIASFVALFLALASAQPWVPAPGQSANWMQRHKALLNLTRLNGGDVKVVFLGDSHIYRWSTLGEPVWREHYAPREAFNYGIDGDRTEQILWRVQQGELDLLDPKLVVLMNGANNIAKKDNVTAIAKGVSSIIETVLQSKLPKAKLLLLSTLPQASEIRNIETFEFNELISRFADQTRVHWFDLGVFFETSLPHEIAEMYETDQIHLSLKGYQLWQSKMEPIFSKLIE